MTMTMTMNNPMEEILREFDTPPAGAGQRLNKYSRITTNSSKCFPSVGWEGIIHNIVSEGLSYSCDFLGLLGIRQLWLRVGWNSTCKLKTDSPFLLIKKTIIV
jgi:hypothetical protein